MSPTVCLNMIVKNEEKIIERALDSVACMIDSYCICDTGSTDSTVSIIKEFFEKRDIPGKVVYKDFVNFGENRTFALKEAKELADYLLFIDADMIVRGAETFDKDTLTADVYRLKQGSNDFYYYNTRMVSTKVDCSYYGVTHEYVNVGKRNGGGEPTSKQLDTLTIDDIGDGGAKDNKFERDIRLLEQGLVDEPKNARYHFYLANSYRDTGKFEKAIEHYVTRVEMGGWDEEIFYSIYRVGLCYKSLDNEDMMLLHFIKAWRSRPTRMEPLFELVKYYREKKDYKMAKMFYLMAKDISIPKQDVLFIHNDMYDFQLDQEYSLMAFYNGDTKEVYRCFKKLFMRDAANLYGQFNNYKFYVPHIEADKEISLACTHNIDIEGKKHTFHGSSPCIIPRCDGYMVNVRLVNYKVNSDGSYGLQHGLVSTLNKCILYDKDFNATTETILDKDKSGHRPAGWASDLAGVEDVKLCIYDKQIWYTGTKCHSNNKIGCVYGLYDQNNAQGLNPIELTMIDKNCEKNWVFIPGDDMQMVYKWRPLQIGKKEENTLSITKTSPMPKLFEMARGSTNGFPYQDEIWFVVHFVHQWKSEPRFYYHAVVIFDEDMNFKQCTYPFKFSKKPIEYCLGLVVEDDRIIFSHSVYDDDAQLKIVHKRSFLEKYIM